MLWNPASRETVVDDYIELASANRGNRLGSNSFIEPVSRVLQEHFIIAWVPQAKESPSGVVNRGIYLYKSGSNPMACEGVSSYPSSNTTVTLNKLSDCKTSKTCYLHYQGIAAAAVLTTRDVVNQSYCFLENKCAIYRIPNWRPELISLWGGVANRVNHVTSPNTSKK